MQSAGVAREKGKEVSSDLRRNYPSSSARSWVAACPGASADGKKCKNWQFALPE